MAAPLLPEVSHYITTNDSAGKSTYLDAPNPPPIYSRRPNYRIDYIYSALGSATGPVLTDRADYKEHQQVSATPPHILFPVEGASAACVVTYAPNPNNEDGFMHRTNTLDYVFIIDGEFELSLDSGEKRIMKKGDVCIQRASMHAWKNLSKTEIARFGAVCLGIEGAKVNEAITPEKGKE